MRIIKEYKILSSEGTEILETRIQKYIELGWQPLGGVSITCLDHPSMFRYAQAIGKASKQ
jgi:hypothetical protein